jgi:hypothetical protein
VVVYNVTVKVMPERNAEWLDWMRSEHLPDVMSTGLFQDFRLARLLGQDDSDGMTYSIQLTCREVSDFEVYERDYASRLRHEHVEKFPENVTFRTLMEVI